MAEAAAAAPPSFERVPPQPDQAGGYADSHQQQRQQQRPADGAPGDWAIPSEQQPLVGGYNYLPSVMDAPKTDRQNFIQKVYGILCVQLVITFGIALPIATSDDVWITENQWLLYLANAGLIIMLCAMCCAQDAMRVYPTNYIFLGVMTGCMSILVGFASAAYTWQSVCLAVGVTAVMFLLLTLYACNTQTDFTGMGPYLFAALCALTLFTMVAIVLGIAGINISWLVLILDIIGVLLFTFYIIYDTQLILGGKHDTGFTIDDYAFAALSLYLDIVNLFLHILSLLGDRDK